MNRGPVDPHVTGQSSGTGSQWRFNIQSRSAKWNFISAPLNSLIYKLKQHSLINRMNSVFIFIKTNKQSRQFRKSGFDNHPYFWVGLIVFDGFWQQCQSNPTLDIPFPTEALVWTPQCWNVENGKNWKVEPPQKDETWKRRLFPFTFEGSLDGIFNASTFQPSR